MSSQYEKFVDKMDSMGIKKCPNCGEWSYTEEYHRRSKTEKDGACRVFKFDPSIDTIIGYCKKCNKTTVIEKPTKIRLMGDSKEETR